MSEMSNKANETIADIVAEKRREAQDILSVNDTPGGRSEAHDLTDEADRIEAAYRRQEPELYDLMRENVRLRAALKPVLECGSPDDPCDMCKGIEHCWPDEGDPKSFCDIKDACLAVRDAQRIYTDGKESAVKGGPKKLRTLTDWEWTMLVAAWRYYEHRHSITAVMFPHKVVERFFTGRYDDESCIRIANQFVCLDHYSGQNDEFRGWAGDEMCGECRAWRLFYFYLRTWLCGFPTAKVMLDGKSARVDVFRADGKWFARGGYEKFGENVSPYKDCEIEFDKGGAGQ